MPRASGQLGPCSRLAGAAESRSNCAASQSPGNGLGSRRTRAARGRRPAQRGLGRRAAALCSFCRQPRRRSWTVAAASSDDPYSLLNVSRGASREEIRAAYIEAIRAAHPDVNPFVDTTRAAAAINAAYEALVQEDVAHSSRWGSAAAPADVFDAPEAEATELFVNPFDIAGVSPLAWRELQAAARRGRDPAEALWQAGVAVGESGIASLTPGQLAEVEAGLERLDADPSPVALEVAAYVLADQLARAARANARQPAPRRAR